MYYEFSSLLNEVRKLYAELNLASEPHVALPLSKIYEIEKKLQEERSEKGCCVLEQQIINCNRKLYITMEWKKYWSYNQNFYQF